MRQRPLTDVEPPFTFALRNGGSTSTPGVYVTHGYTGNERMLSKTNGSFGKIQRWFAALPLENSAKVDPIDDFSLVQRRAAFDSNCSPKRDRTFDPPTSIGKFKDCLASLVGKWAYDRLCAGGQSGDQSSGPQTGYGPCEEV